MPVKKKSGKSKAHEFEYVTSMVSVLPDDGIVVHVLNDSSVSGNTHVVIYENTGAGAIVATDSGPVTIIPTWGWGLGFTISQSGEYWVRIRASSQFLIPKASFERYENSTWVPVVSYRPGDFAVFKLHPRRKRIW
jgi:hypothetical protein